MGVFDPNVFDPNVFDTETRVVVPIGTGIKVVGPSGGAGLTLRGRMRHPKKGRAFRRPDFRSTLPRKTEALEFKSYEPIKSEEQLREERWRAWQASPAAVGKGSASILEFMVWEFLVYKKNLKEGLDFIYQYPLLGGRTQFGGYVADFYFPFRQEVWNPAGLQFHWTTAQHRARDLMAKKILASKGIKTIYLWEDDMLNRPDYVLNLAWDRGAEVPGRSTV